MKQAVGPEVLGTPLVVDGRSVEATLDAEAEPRDTGAAGFLDGQGTIVLDKV